MSGPETFILPWYKKTSAGHLPIDGVQFFSYRTGVSRYARISEDGQIKVQRDHNRATYGAQVIGHGLICTTSGKGKRFQTSEAAARAAIKIHREIRK